MLTVADPGRGITVDIADAKTLFEKVEKKNKENLGRVKSGEWIAYEYSMMRVPGGSPIPLLTIGVHDAATRALMKSATSKNAGKIVVTRNLVQGKGVLDVSGNPSNQKEFREVVERISKKKVNFV